MQNEFLTGQKSLSFQETNSKKAKQKARSAKNTRQEFNIIIERVDCKDAGERLHQAYKILLKNFFEKSLDKREEVW